VKIREIFTAKAGDETQLDCIYKWQGLLPRDSYDNIDDKGNLSELGDCVRFHRDVRITATISVSD
jgi:hypothetical protein